MLVRRFLLSLFILTSLIGTAGCRGSALRADAYRSHPFRVEVEGMLGGISFGAQIGYDGREREITYLSPEALSGITLRETGEGVRIEADGQTAEIPAEAVAGLLSPLTVLFSETEPLQVRKNGSDTELVRSDGGILTLNSDGVPKEYLSEQLRFRTVRWESDKKAP